VISTVGHAGSDGLGNLKRYLQSLLKDKGKYVHSEVKNGDVLPLSNQWNGKPKLSRSIIPKQFLQAFSHSLANHRTIPKTNIKRIVPAAVPRWIETNKRQSPFTDQSDDEDIGPSTQLPPWLIDHLDNEQNSEESSKVSKRPIQLPSPPSPDPRPPPPNTISSADRINSPRLIQSINRVNKEGKMGAEHNGSLDKKPLLTSTTRDFTTAYSIKPSPPQKPTSSSALPLPHSLKQPFLPLDPTNPKIPTISTKTSPFLKKHSNPIPSISSRSTMRIVNTHRNNNQSSSFIVRRGNGGDKGKNRSIDCTDSVQSTDPTHRPAYNLLSSAIPNKRKQETEHSLKAMDAFFNSLQGKIDNKGLQAITKKSEPPASVYASNRSSKNTVFSTKQAEKKSNISPSLPL